MDKGKYVYVYVCECMDTLVNECIDCILAERGERKGGCSGQRITSSVFSVVSEIQTHIS